MSGQYDLIVVGGGLGGATLARSLARHGASVLVLERETEFRDRVRGEFVAPWGVAEAKHLGIYDLLVAGVAHQIRWVDFYDATTLALHRDAIATTPHQLACLAFYHPEMQEVLLAAASSAGAHVRRGVSVWQVRTGASPSVVVEANGKAEEVHVRLVVGADGRASTVRSAAEFHVRRDPIFAFLFATIART